MSSAGNISPTFLARYKRARLNIIGSPKTIPREVQHSSVSHIDYRGPFLPAQYRKKLGALVACTHLQAYVRETDGHMSICQIMLPPICFSVEGPGCRIRLAARESAAMIDSQTAHRRKGCEVFCARARPRTGAFRFAVCAVQGSPWQAPFEPHSFRRSKF